MKTKVLLVEDDDSLRNVLKAVLEAESYSVCAYASAEDAILNFSKDNPNIVISDFKLPGINGVELLTQIRKKSSRVPFLLMTAFGSIEIAVEAMKQGASDFITKPFDPQFLNSVIKDLSQHNRIIEREKGLRKKGHREFSTENADAERLLHYAAKAAAVDTPVLILGESGTGKELIARYIHDNSKRADKPFVAVNCAALPAELLESELFGHEAGAFTGATQKRVGIFEYASEGTIFLDEVGDMPLPLQVKLLRALQEGEIKRVGSNKTIKVSPRIVSATNIDIMRAINDGKIREDFFYRIAVITFEIAPLRKRPEDIELLTGKYLEYFAAKVGTKNVKISADAKQTLQKYHWPGNARELENVIERAVILSEGEIESQHLGISLSPTFQAIEEAAVTLPEIAQRAAQQAEISLISETLAKTDGNKSKAAKLLGVSYKTLLNKVKEYNLSG